MERSEVAGWNLRLLGANSQALTGELGRTQSAKRGGLFLTNNENALKLYQCTAASDDLIQ